MIEFGDKNAAVSPHLIKILNKGTIATISRKSSFATAIRFFSIIGLYV